MQKNKKFLLNLSSLDKNGRAESEKVKKAG
jgi:hypothetical protein